VKKKKVNRQISIDEPHTKVIRVIRSEKIKKDYLNAIKDSCKEANKTVILKKNRLNDIYTTYN